jgi:hypothetical protein
MMQRSRPAAFATLIETTGFGAIQLAENVHEVRLAYLMCLSQTVDRVQQQHNLRVTEMRDKLTVTFRFCHEPPALTW